MADSATVRRLRARYRPSEVRVLLVGESAPAGGTHYYLGNSNLFSAVRAAFVLMYGRRTPEGTDFLAFACDKGLWLIDLASDSVNRLQGDARARPVAAGSARVTRTIRETDPGEVVAVKATIASTVAGCLERSGSEAELVALPFPLMQWRRVFVEGLATVLRRARRRPDGGR